MNSTAHSAWLPYAINAFIFVAAVTAAFVVWRKIEIRSRSRMPPQDVAGASSVTQHPQTAGRVREAQLDPHSSARLAPHVGHAGVADRCPSKGCFRAARPRRYQHHARHLLARHAGHAGRRCADRRKPHWQTVVTPRRSTKPRSTDLVLGVAVCRAVSGICWSWRCRWCVDSR